MSDQIYISETTDAIIVMVYMFWSHQLAVYEIQIA